MNDADDDRDPIGDGSGTHMRRLPPEQRRSRKRNGNYRKYHSGNLKGRPREVMNLGTSFIALLEEKDPAAGNGGRILSKQEAVMRTLFYQATTGNQKAFVRFVSLSKRAGYLDPPAPARAPERAATAVSGDMEQFKADFGKPLPESSEP